MNYKFTFLIIFFTLVAHSQLIPRSTVGPTHQAVQFTTDQNGFVFAYAEPDGSLPTGILRKTTDGGATWTSFPITFSPTLPVDPTVNTIIVQNKLQMIDNNVGFCAGILNSTFADNRMVLKTTDSGISWTGFAFTANVDIESIFFIDANVGYVGVSRKVYKTVDGGETWNIVLDIVTGPSFTTIRFINPSTGFACASGRIYKSTDSGETWSLTSFGSGINTQSITALSFITDEIGFVSTSNGKILKTLDAGNTWNTIYNETINDNLSSIDIINQKIIIGGYNQSGSSTCNTFLLSSTDDGITWSKECFNFSFPTPRYVYSLDFLTETKGFLAVEGGMYEYNTTLSTTDYEIKDYIVYPNPSNGIFTIQNHLDSENKWFVYNSIGQLIAFGNKEFVDLTACPIGLYYLKYIKNQSEVKTVKIVKK